MLLLFNFTAADLYTAAAHLPSDIEDGCEAVLLKNLGVSGADEATWQTLVDAALVLDREPLPDGVREQAALICAIDASRGGVEWEGDLQDAGLDFAAVRLAAAAFRQVSTELAALAAEAEAECRLPAEPSRFVMPSAFEIAGEAEALLRSGWEP